MFCNKCGSEIVEDSIYCSYCGVKVEDAQSASVRPASPEKKPSARSSAPDDDCVHPGAPKKHCTVCGKELPSSTVNDTCALCTVRVRNNESRAEERRTETAYKNRDRHDDTDKFDQTVFERDRAQYYRGGRSEHAVDIKNGVPKGCLIGGAVIAAAVVLMVVIGIVGFLSFSAVGRPEPMPEPVMESVELMPEVSVSVDGDNVTIHDPSQEFIAEELYDNLLQPAATELLHNYFAEVFTYTEGALTIESDAEQVGSSDAFLTLTGEYTWSGGNATQGGYFEIWMIASKSSFYPVLLTVDGQMIFDDLAFFGPDGTLTNEGADLFGMDAGEIIFGEPLIRLADD